MPAYTFDMKLDASVTVEAATGDEALAMLRQAMVCADCNGGALPNGDPILFEASMNQRPNIGMIDGEDVSVTTLIEWAELRAREFLIAEAAKRGVKLDIIEAVRGLHYGVETVDISFIGPDGLEDDVSIWNNQGTLSFGNGAPWH